MLSPGNIIYGHCTITSKPKYLISLYRSDEYDIIACFTTSQSRGSATDHGCIKDCNGYIIGYLFLNSVKIGLVPADKVTEFSFPVVTRVMFDYCFQEGFQQNVLDKFEEPKIVCALFPEEYTNLIYQMYKSPKISGDYKKIFEKILEAKSEPVDPVQRSVHRVAAKIKSNNFSLIQK